MDQHINALTISCQWDNSGFYHGAADKISLREHKHFVNYLNAMEVEHTNLDQQTMHVRFGTSLYQTDVHVKRGALVQPAALVRGLADGLPANVRLVENCPVLSIN